MKNTHSGQGLIEVLIILLFVGASITAILTFQSYLSYSNSLARQQADATLLATSQMETWRDFSVLNVTAGYTAYQSIVTGSVVSTVGNTSYTTTSTITTNASPNYKTAVIVVSWTDQYGNAQSITLVSDIGSLDPGIPASFM